MEKEQNQKTDYKENNDFDTEKTNQNNEKITALYSGYAKPLVKKYNFIKGFDEGYLDFYSIKNNNISLYYLNEEAKWLFKLNQTEIFDIDLSLFNISFALVFGLTIRFIFDLNFLFKYLINCR